MLSGQTRSLPSPPLDMTWQGHVVHQTQLDRCSSVSRWGPAIVVSARVWSDQQGQQQNKKRKNNPALTEIGQMLINYWMRLKNSCHWLDLRVATRDADCRLNGSVYFPVTACGTATLNSRRTRVAACCSVSGCGRWMARGTLFVSEDWCSWHDELEALQSSLTTYLPTLATWSMRIRFELLAVSHLQPESGAHVCSLWSSLSLSWPSTHLHGSPSADPGCGLGPFLVNQHAGLQQQQRLLSSCMMTLNATKLRPIH